MTKKIGYNQSALFNKSSGLDIEQACDLVDKIIPAVDETLSGLGLIGGNLIDSDSGDTWSHDVDHEAEERLTSEEIESARAVFAQALNNIDPKLGATVDTSNGAMFIITYGNDEGPS